MKKILVKKNKNKRKGFTLVELLAIIIILGIIALIAIPIVNGVIDGGKTSANETSARTLIKSVNEKNAALEMQGTILKDGRYSVEELLELGLKIKGSQPDSGYAVVVRGDVKECDLWYEDQNVVCNYKEQDVATFEYDSSSWEKAEYDTYIAKVYYDPTTGTKCTEQDANKNLANYSTTKKDVNGNKSKIGLKSGCMTWYAYKDNGDGTVKMILDHNTTGVSNAAANNNDSSLSVLYDTLRSDTNGWKVSADLMDVDDIATITGADRKLKFSSQNYYFKETSGLVDSSFGLSDVDKSYKEDKYKYFWLLENLYFYSNFYGKNADMSVSCTGYWFKNIANTDNLDKENGFDFTRNVYLWNIGSAFMISTNENGTIGMDRFESTGLVAADFAYFKYARSVGIRPVIDVSRDVFK